MEILTLAEYADAVRYAAEESYGKAFEDKVSLMAVGPPGCAKSQIPAQVAFEEGWGFGSIQAGPSTPPDVMGYPFPAEPRDGEERTAEFLPFGLFARIRMSDPSKPFLLRIEDLHNATPVMQGLLQQVIETGVAGEIELPRHVVIVVTANRREDAGAGSLGILSTVKGRLAVFGIAADPEGWLKWGAATGIHAAVLQFVDQEREALWAPVTRDEEPTPSPRNWARVSRIMQAQDRGSAPLQRSPNLAGKLVAGCIGSRLKGAFMTLYRAQGRSLDIDAILRDPGNAPIPAALDELQATVRALAWRGTPATANACMIYMRRLFDASQEAGMLLAHLLRKRVDGIERSAAWLALQKHPVYAPIMAQVREVTK